MHGGKPLRVQGLGQAGQALGQQAQAARRKCGGIRRDIGVHGFLQGRQALSIQTASCYHGA